MSVLSVRVPYNKPYMSAAELCDKLVAQGITVADRDFAARVLKRCSYYRFKAYLLPFSESSSPPRRYQAGTTFEQCYALYQFDEALRNLVFDVVGKVEVGIRSGFEEWMTKQTDNRFWYLDSALFKENGEQVKTVSRVRDMFKDSKEQFAEHYRSKYYNNYCPFFRDLPPGWVAIELMTFGNVSKLMRSLQSDQVNALKMNRFAKTLNVEKYQTLCAWVDAIHQVRNHCAHHSRLFNRNLPAPTGIKRILSPDVALVRTRPDPTKREEDQLNRLYTVLAAVQQLYNGLGYDAPLGPVLVDLFERYPVAKRFMPSMGFPADWENEPLFFR
jgi:abortive infection bacteriophage resistance protein